MDISRFLHLKKYLILGTSLISVVLLWHLIWVYIFLNGKYVWLPGWSVSIGLIGKPVEIMNPFSYGKEKSGNLVFRFLFRSLLSYDPSTGTFVSDLAECDLSNIQKIECTLKNNIEWSDKSSIQDSDVLATFEAFWKNSPESKMSTFLKGVNIVSSKWKIILTSKSKNPLMLDLLTYPIIRSDMIEQMRTDRFSSGLYITSGLYKFFEEAHDDEYNFDRITLIRNDNSGLKGAWLDKIHFKYFEDSLTLDRSLETLNIIIPPGRDMNITLTWRFREYEYSGYEFFWVFFHTDRLEKTLRNGLHWQIGTLLSGSIDPTHKRIESFFENVGNTLPTKQLGNFSDILQKNGYLRKEELMANIDKEATTVTWGIVYDAPRFFENKEKSNVLFSKLPDKEKGIILYGNVPPATTSVTINGYDLQEFKPWNTEFAYKVSENNGFLTSGKNEYRLVINSGAVTATWELITLYVTDNTGTLESFRTEVNSWYLARLNTPALISLREQSKEERKTKIAPLDGHYYYNAKWEPFTLKLAFTTWAEWTEAYAEAIATILKNLGVVTELVAYKPEDIENIIKSGKKDYDILVLWIETPGNIGHIGQLFLSSEAWVWVNFSNIESSKLDDLFIDLRWATLEEKVQKITKDITLIMREESFFLPLSSPIKKIYIDRNLKWVTKLGTIPDMSSFYSLFNYVSIKDSYVMDLRGKWIGWFISWFFNLIF